MRVLALVLLDLSGYIRGFIIFTLLGSIRFLLNNFFGFLKEIKVCCWFGTLDKGMFLTLT